MIRVSSSVEVARQWVMSRSSLSPTQAADSDRRPGVRRRAAATVTVNCTDRATGRATVALNHTTHPAGAAVPRRRRPVTDDGSQPETPARPGPQSGYATARNDCEFPARHSQGRRPECCVRFKFGLSR